MTAGPRQWPRRRWVLAAAAFPVLVFLFAGAGGLAVSAAPWWTVPWLILISALASVVVASYLALPGTRKIIDAGCSPCAVVAGLALVAAMMGYSSAPASPVMAVVALALTAFALRQRLTSADSCPAPAAPRTGSTVSPRPADPSSVAGTELPTADDEPSAAADEPSAVPSPVRSLT